MRSEKLAEENGGGGVVGGGGEEGGGQNSFPNTRTRRSPLCHLCWILTRAFTEQPTPVSHGTAKCDMSHKSCCPETASCLIYFVTLMHLHYDSARPNVNTSIRLQRLSNQFKPVFSSRNFPEK